MVGKAIGIDLGTTYSCVGVYEHGKVEIIANDQGFRTTPSIVAFTDDERLVGEAAKNQISRNQNNTVFDVKRLIGRKYDDSSVESDKKHWSFNIINLRKKPAIKVSYKGEEKTFSPEELSSMVLLKMKETAQAYLGYTVEKAVITVPAYFNNAQRQATIDAAEIAGLKVLRIINEPTAAAFAYGLHREDKNERKVLIFDLGGGTFDVSILSIKKGNFEVLATAGKTHLGGNDFDVRMVDYFVKEFLRKYEINFSQIKKPLGRLRTECEKAKRILSSTVQTSIELDALCEGIDFSSKISRATFEDLCSDLFAETLDPVNTALADACLNKYEIDDIVLVGGSTRIPKIQQLLQNFFNGKELNKSINADEAVAYGAAIQASILNGDDIHGIKDIVLHDVIPLSLGIQSKGGIMSTVVERNTKIPHKESKSFTTADDDQTSVDFRVYEGERALTRGNTLLGRFDLNGIPPAPQGIPDIEVTFNIDNNGILNVAAVDELSGNTSKINIKYENGRLSKEEIGKMIYNSEMFKRDDEKERTRIEAKNDLESLCKRMKSALQGNQLRRSYGFDTYSIYFACNEGISWLNRNSLASIDVLEKKHGQIKDICNPFLKRINISGENIFRKEYQFIQDHY